MRSFILHSIHPLMVYGYGVKPDIEQVWPQVHKHNSPSPMWSTGIVGCTGTCWRRSSSSITCRSRSGVTALLEPMNSPPFTNPPTITNPQPCQPQPSTPQVTNPPLRMVTFLTHFGYLLTDTVTSLGLGWGYAQGDVVVVSAGSCSARFSQARLRLHPPRLRAPRRNEARWA